MLTQLFDDPKAFLIMFLLCLPGRLLAISAHESAHGYVAYKCGDPTAKLLGRITLNPLKHFDPTGFFLMLFVGIGWAKPVPVNPNNYRHARRDDIKVSLAGITMNFILFLAGVIIVYLFLFLTLKGMPVYDLNSMPEDSVFMMKYAGKNCLMFLENGSYSYIEAIDIFIYAFSDSVADILITPLLGSALGYLYKIFIYGTIVNLSLMLFNLLPVPPLDGYHVLNDLVLKKSLFASRKIAQAGTFLLLALSVSGYLGDIMSYAINFVLDAFASGAVYLFSSVI